VGKRVAREFITRPVNCLIIIAKLAVILVVTVNIAFMTPITTATPPMKAHELFTSSQRWCKESPAEDSQGNKLEALSAGAVKWCALGAIQKVYAPSQWSEVMDALLRGLSVSERGLAQMNRSDKACSIMEWNDDPQSSFEEIKDTLLSCDI
jgi:hypothetical protein